MSQLCKDKISCPKCQTEGEFEYWSSVNVDLDPELKKKIFNEEIFIWTCPKCGREFSRQNQDHYCVKPETIDAYISQGKKCAGLLF